MSIGEEVIELVARKTGIPARKISSEKTFFQLGIDGDDAVELIAELCEHYHVPCEHVDLNQYIGPEGAFTIGNQLFNTAARKAVSVRKELTIADLIKTAETRRWFDETS